MENIISKEGFFSFKRISLISFQDTFRGLKTPPEAHTLVFLSGSEFDDEFLSKILKATGLQVYLHAVPIQLTPDQSFMFFEHFSVSPFKQVISFGCPPEKMGLRIKHALYKPFTFRSISWLFCEELVQIQNDKQRKGLLWNALKDIFLSEK